jgi:signal transduction histidine kinase
VRTLRGRLTLGVLAVLAAVLVVAGILVARDVERSERRDLDDRLRRTAELSQATALAAVERELPDVDRRLDAVLGATDSALRLTVGDTVLLDSGDPLPLPRRSRLGLRTVTVRGRHYRIYTTDLGGQDLGGLVRLQVAGSLSGVEAGQASLRRRLAALGALMLLVAGAGVWLAADVVLRPLRRLRTVATSVAGEGDLARRVPARGAAELRELADSFNAMLVRLARSAEDRTRALAATRRFAANAGHELRTPLTSVQATLSAIARHPDMEPRRRAELAHDALTEQRRLVHLLDGLQALARGDAPPSETAPVDLAELVEASADAASMHHPGVRLSSTGPGTPVVVSGWEPGLRMLVDNLLENAAIHGRPRGEVRVTLHAPAAAQGPQLEVEDDGPGIPPDERERIFDPFARLDGTGRPGSGLGLALVAQQAALHGAEIAVEPSGLGGARFSVRFPPDDGLRDARARPAPAPRSPPPATAGMAGARSPGRGARRPPRGASGARPWR